MGIPFNPPCVQLCMCYKIWLVPSLFLLVFLLQIWRGEIGTRRRIPTGRDWVRVSYKILFWPAIFQRFFPSSALSPVLRASHIAQEPTGSFPRPSFLAPGIDRSIKSSQSYFLSLCGRTTQKSSLRAGCFLLFSPPPSPSPSFFSLSSFPFARASNMAASSIAARSLLVLPHKKQPLRRLLIDESRQMPVLCWGPQAYPLLIVTCKPLLI